jgi:hypothetical protein
LLLEIRTWQTTIRIAMTTMSSRRPALRTKVVFYAGWIAADLGVKWNL